MSSKHYLPSKVLIYLRRIAVEYQTLGNSVADRVVRSAKIYVREEASYDNWNGGMDGHDVILFLPPEVYGEVTLARKHEYENDILEKLRTCSNSVDNEFFSAVRFEDEDENDPEYQNAVSLHDRPQPNPDNLSIWKQGQVRLFISHRDIYKSLANELADGLQEFGISSFVAHDTIQPMTTWQHEIIKGLETMEIMLAFVTDDFRDSVWTNQEIGFALGRNIPIVSLKLQNADPAGFIGNQQALRGNFQSLAASALKIYKLLAEKLGRKDRMQTGLVSAFVQAPSFSDTKIRFDRMKSVITKLSDDELALIVNAFRENDQLYGSVYLTSGYNRLKNFVKQAAGRDCEVGRRVITFVDDDSDVAF